MRNKNLISMLNIFGIGIFGLVLMVVFTCLLSSCGRKCYPQEIETERIVNDTVWIERAQLRQDSASREHYYEFTVLDSIAPRIDSAGRLTGLDRFRIEKILEKEFVNVVHKERVSNVKKYLRKRTLLKTVNITTTIEKELSWWQKVLMWFGGLCFAGAVVLIYRKVR